jgi:hypothetical protein
MTEWRRTLVLVGLALLQLILAAAVTIETADVAWVPGYFDGDDGDSAPFALSDRLPALASPAGGLIPLLAALAVVVAWPPAGPRRIAPARVRFRAPPLA